jgi:uncharacterized protein with gpF-like domain
MDQVRLLRIYMRVVNHWSEARGRLVEAYGRELGLLTTDSISDIQSDIDAEGSWFTRLFIELRADITAWAVSVEQWQRGKWRGAVLSASGVDLDTQLFAGDVQQTVESMIAQNVSLLKDMNAQQQEKITGVIFRGLNQRLPARDVAKQLQEVAAFGKRRSLLIASDQLQKASVALTQERAYQAGLGPEYEYVHSGKHNFRPWHKARNGKIFSDAAKPGDEKYIAPDDQPGIPVRCGCRKKYLLNLEGDEE